MNKGSTPQYLRAWLGRLEAARVFPRAKANVQSGANEGDTEALEAAAHMNHEDIVTLLCDFGVMDTAGTALCSLSHRGSCRGVRHALESAAGCTCRYRLACLHQHRPRSEQPSPAHLRPGTLSCSSTLARLLLDQGAGTTPQVPLHATMVLRYAKKDENVVGDNKLDGLKGAIRSLHEAR